MVGALLIEKHCENAGGERRQGKFLLRPEMDFQTAIVALAVLIISGLLASLLPASKAASVNPITALQDE